MMSDTDAENLIIDDVKFRVGDHDDPDLCSYHPVQYQGYSNEDEVSTESDDDTYDGTDSQPDQLSKPLMHPRKRTKVKCHQPKRTWRWIIWPAIYIFLFLASMAAFVCLIIYSVNSYTNKLLFHHGGTAGSHKMGSSSLVGCSKVEVEDVWVAGFAKLLTESSIRMLDMNNDGTLDVVMAFATGGDRMTVPSVVCDIYFNGTKPCGGGIMVLDGQTGKQIWRHYSQHEMFSLNCGADLDGDNIPDCIGAGRVGVFEGVSGHDGHLLWKYEGPTRNEAMNLYQGQFIPDVDGDGILDILNIHGGDPLGEPGSETRLAGELVVFSGRTGQVLQWMWVPDKRESYYSPVLYKRKDGTDIVLLGTGGETHGGSLWYVTLDDVLKGKIQNAQPIVSDPYKGYMTPPVLVDLNKDGVQDIVFAAYNSTLHAIDGETYETIWNFTFPMSETYATPAPGFYNDDDIPDFFVKWQYGPGFPIYYHSWSTVLDGKTGEPIINPYLRDSVGAQSSPLTVSMDGLGNDLFLHWMADCTGHESQGGKYAFKKGTNVHEKSRSDFCRLRFKSEGFSKFMAIGQNFPEEGISLYNSVTRKTLEHSVAIDTGGEALQFLESHPEHLKSYRKWQQWVEQIKQEMINKKSEDPTKSDGVTDDNEDLSIDRGDQAGDYNLGSASYNSYQVPESSSFGNLLSDYGRYGSSASGKYNQREGMQNKFGGDMWGRGDYLGRDNQQYDDTDTDTAYNNDVIQRVLGDGEESRNMYHQISDMMSSFIGSRNQNVKPSEPSYGYDPSWVGQSRNIVGRSQRTQPQGKVSTQKTKEKESNQDQLAAKYLSQAFSNSENTEKDSERRKRSQNFQSAHVKLPRRRRHVGPHDEGGLQRLISTGSLAPPLLDPSHPDYAHSMDIVFAVYWFFPAHTEALLPEDEECIDNLMKNETIRFDPTSKYYGMDHDGFEDAVTDECLEKSGHQLPEGGTYESQITYNPYDIHMGQMTIYRLRLKCTCPNTSKLAKLGKKCSRVLPFEEQQWSGYMGSLANSQWRSRKVAER